MPTAEYDKTNSLNAITNDGKTISVTKVGYNQETVFVDESGKTYLQDAATLELVPNDDIDDNLVNEPVVKDSAGVIKSSTGPEGPKRQAKSARTEKK